MTLIGTPLVARTVPIDAPVDLVALAGDDGVLLERDGVGLAGWGEALRIDLPTGLAGAQAPARVAEALDAIVAEDAVGLPGCGPVAIGALPFAPGAAGTLVVPEVVVGRSEDGTSWMTSIGAPGTVGVLRPAPTPQPGPDAFTLTPSMSHQAWARVVERAVSDIRRGVLGKVVLAREVVVEANRAIDVGAVLRRLRALYPSCLVYSVSGFVGASPELLLRRRGDEVSSHPLAGTIPHSGDAVVDAELARSLLGSAKDRAEHRFVVDDVVRALAPRCASLAIPEHPSIVSLRNVSHLGTRIDGRLATPSTALELAALLHPTAAVGGTPRAAALRWLDRHEGIDRGRYAGPVGWVDARGDGEWMVGIRCAVIDGSRARLYAGVGVVADSDPASELAETQLKLQALLAALVRP